MVKILLADDNRVLVKALAAAVPWAEHDVEVCGCAFDGEEARLLLTDEIDVLVTDVRMPKMSGVELTRYAGEHFPNLQVVFMSAYTEFDYAVSALKLNVFDYITKPVDNEKLLDTVLKAYAAKKSREEMKALLASSLPYMQEHILARMLQGDNVILLSQAKLAFPSWTEKTWFACMTFDLLLREFDAAIWEIKAMAQQHMPDAHCAVMHDGLLAVVFFQEEEPAKETVDQWLDEANDIIRRQKQQGRDVTVGFSQSRQGPDRLRTLYQQALRALNMRYLVGRDGVYAAPAASLPESPACRQMQDALLCADGLFRIADSQRLKERLSELRSTLDRLESREQYVVAALGAMNIYMREQFGSPENLTSLCHAYLDVQNRICKGSKNEGLDALCGFISARRDDRFSQVSKENRDVIKRIYDAIDRVGFDTDGGLERIAQDVYLSPSYVSMLFKQETGKSISQYLGQLRLERAQKLLRDPTLKIYEVSQKVGYPNQYYFSVWFKKNTGLTPSDYRDQQS